MMQKGSKLVNFCVVDIAQTASRVFTRDQNKNSPRQFVFVSGLLGSEINRAIIPRKIVLRVYLIQK